MAIDVRSADVDPITEHAIVRVHSMVPKFSMRERTEGTYLEFIDVFELPPGVRAEPHYHNTHEFYFILEGEAVMQIEDEVQKVGPNQLIYIPPNAKHTARILGAPVRGLSFALSYQEPFDPGYYPCELAEVTLDDSLPGS
jgi:mannose-6-phosphate isomerase-like protein (cupin superfamily)